MAPPRKRAGQASGRRRLEGEVLDVAAIAALLGTSEKCVRSRVARQMLPHRKWSGRVVFLRSEVMAFLSKLDGCDVEQALAAVAARQSETTR
jgi:helix-turn-helix protein